MQLSPLGLAALREYNRRHPAQIPGDSLAERTATELRAWFHPKQRAFFARVRGKERSRWRALLKSRRVGATAGGVRELLAAALESPGFRATYVSKTAVDARDRAWTNDNKTGILDLIRELGEPVKLRRQKLESYRLGGITVAVKDLAMKLDFTNGSQIEVFGANNVDRQASKRGAAKHVFWVDEAQDFPDLDEFIAVISPALRDFGGECWLTGTPGRDCAGLFYEVTKDEVDGDERPEGWDVHHINVIDNPFFGTVVKDRRGEDQWWVEDNLAGDRRLTFAERLRHRHGPFKTREEADRVAAEVRWDISAGAEMREKGLKGDEPDFIREWLGQWVKIDAAFVYPVHSIPKRRLIYAPQRLLPNPLVGTDPRFDGHPPWYDHHAAVRDLPRVDAQNRPHKWLYSLWFDFGFWPDPFAAVLWAFTPTLHDVFEMFSWKQTRLHADDQATYIRMLWEVESAIVSFGGDAAGKQADFAEWHRRFNMPLEEANKQGKNTLEEMLAGDIRRGFVHFREGSPLLTEMRFLVYLPTAPGKPRIVHKHRKVNGVIHGDHCCDGARYGFSALTHYLSKIPGERPLPGTRAAYQLEEAKIEQDLDEREAKLQERLADADELAEEYGRVGTYERDGYAWG